jgi:hypothetical protein
MPSCPSDREQIRLHQLALPTQSIADLCVVQPREVTIGLKSHLNRIGSQSVHGAIRGVSEGQDLAEMRVEKKYKYVGGIGRMHSGMIGNLFNHSVISYKILAHFDRTFNCTNDIFILRDISASLTTAISQRIIDSGLL